MLCLGPVSYTHLCEWAQRIVVLLGGKVVADGPRDEIFGNRALLKEVGIRPPEIFSMGQALEERALCYTVEEFTRCFGAVSYTHLDVYKRQSV